MSGYNIVEEFGMKCEVNSCPDSSITSSSVKTSETPVIPEVVVWIAVPRGYETFSRPSCRSAAHSRGNHLWNEQPIDNLPADNVPLDDRLLIPEETTSESDSTVQGILENLPMGQRPTGEFEK
jgi:hypothetical protein